MSDSDRGAYTPPTDAPLSFDARQPVRGSRPVPMTLIISAIVLTVLVVAIIVFYRSGAREPGQPPQTVGSTVGDMKTAPPASDQPADPAAGLQIYQSESPQGATPVEPTFTPPPEQPQVRIAPPQAAPAPAAPAPKPAAATPAPTQPAAKPVVPPPAAQPAAKPVAAAPKPPAPKPAAPVPAASGGSASVQIGAFSSNALADQGWSDAARIAPGLAAGKGKTVERVERDGKTLFRTLVTGFGSRADAAAFCEKLKGAGKNCFVK